MFVRLRFSGLATALTGLQNYTVNQIWVRISNCVVFSRLLEDSTRKFEDFCFCFLL